MKEEKETKKACLLRVRQEVKDRVTSRLDTERTRSAVRCFLEGILIYAAVADTGADATVVPESVVNKLESRGLGTRRIRLEKPIVFHSAKTDGVDIVRATKMTAKKLSMEVRGVQVVFKNATMLVSKDIDELLMGSDILNAVGFCFRLPNF
jgi:predicted aspartyl protease